MIYMDGDSYMYGSGIEQHLYGFTKFYTGIETMQRFKNGKTMQSNVKMSNMRKKSKKLTDDHVKFIEENNVSAQLRKKGVSLYSRAAGGSSNQAIAMRIIEAVIENDIKTVIFCPTTLQRLIYPKKRSQSLTISSGEFLGEYERYLKKWYTHFNTNQTMYLETNALLGLINFCKDNNIELLGTNTIVWATTNKNKFSPQIQRIIDQVNELCVFDLGSDIDDEKERIFTEDGHSNLHQHIKLAENICTHLKI